MACTKPKGKKSLPQKPRLLVRSITVTQDDRDTLDRLSKDLTDYIGRTVSGSVVMRALVRYAGRQRYDWGLAHLSPFVEQEMTTGVLWGKKR